MLRLRLTHHKFKPFGMEIIHDIWVGQRWSQSNEWWEDQTDEYPTAQEAELALLRSIVDVELETTCYNERAKRYAR